MVIMVGDLKDDNILVQQEYFLHLKIVHNIQNTGAVIVKNNGLRFFLHNYDKCRFCKNREFI